MRVLVTGGTGFVGGRLRETLKDAGHTVRLLVRPGSEHKVTGADAYEIIRGDILNTNACLRASDGCDAVVHLVGIIREFPAKGITFDECHRVATMNIVDAARRMGVQRFVHMSALGVREDASSMYHRTKYAAEELVRHSGMRWTIFRPSWIFGRGDALTRQIIDLISRPRVPLIDGGRWLMQPVSVEDVCGAMTQALSLPETQGKIYELGGPDRIAFRDVVAEIARAVGRNARTMSVPSWGVRPVVRVMQRFASFPLTLDQMRMLREDNVCEIDPYVRVFRMEPRSFLKALPSLVQ